MVKPTVFKMGAGRKWWWRWILTQLVAALQKKKPVDIAPFLCAPYDRLMI